MPERAPSVAEAESLFESGAQFLGMNIVRAAAWRDGAQEGEDEEYEPINPVEMAGVVPYVLDDQFLVVYRRQYHHKGGGGVDLTAAASFELPESLPLGRAKYKSLRGRLATGYCADIVAPYLSAHASSALSLLTAVPAAPAWPKLNVVHPEDMEDDPEA